MLAFNDFHHIASVRLATARTVLNDIDPIIVGIVQ